MTRPGQFGVVRTNGWVAWLIRLATRSAYNHAFVCVGNDGQIIEANPSGVAYGNASEYTTVLWSDEVLTPQQVATITQAARGFVGVPYGFLDIAAFALMTRGVRPAWVWRRLDNTNTLICSQLVAECYTRAGIALCPEKKPGQVSPGDLADVIEHRRVPESW